MHFARCRTNLFLKEFFKIPARPQWLQHLPDILAEVRSLSVPVLDRASVEILFGVGPRRAQQILAHLAKTSADTGGGAALQVGRGLVLPRELALHALERLAADPEVGQARTHAEQVAQTIADRQAAAALRPVRIATASDIRTRRGASLPPTLRLRPGRLEVDFLDLEDLLSQLAELGFAIAHDRDRWRGEIESPAERP